MIDHELVNALFGKSGPVLRYRIATELMDTPQDDAQALRKELLCQDEVQENLRYYALGAEQGQKGEYFYTKASRSPEKTSLQSIYTKLMHGSDRHMLENAAAKLWSLGVRKGFEEIDKYKDTYIDIMQSDFYRTGIMRIGYGINAIAQFLSLLGYANEPAVHTIMQLRLNQLYDFVKEERYNIYVSAADYTGIPSAWRDQKEIIDPELTSYSDTQGDPPLPFIYDILGFIGMKQAGLTEENEKKIDAVIKYVLDERYQKNMKEGYDIFRAPTGKYYSCGWSVHLPGFGQGIGRTGNTQNIWTHRLLLRLELLSHFPIILTLPHMADLRDFFERYRGEDGFYRFPKSFIQESKAGYYVLGARMGLNESRKGNDGIMAESTFRMLRMKKNLGLSA